MGYFLNNSVSIPQAVGTIAIEVLANKKFDKKVGFNTASGRYYCNPANKKPENSERSRLVSIPQAVGTIAICNLSYFILDLIQVSIPQAVGTIAIAGLTKPVFMGLKNRFWKTSHRKRSKRAPI